MSAERRSYAFVAEVARALRVEDKDVRRWMRSDGLPALRVPTRTKTVPRISLRELHGWLLERRSGRAEVDFEVWAEDFWKASAKEGRAA